MDYKKSYIEQYLARAVQAKWPDVATLLLETFDVLQSSCAPSNQMVCGLMNAVSDKHPPVYELSAEFMGCLAERSDNALKAIQTMAKSEHAHVRHNALLCLNSRLPADICIQVIRSGLADKSSKVRRKAADWLHRFLLERVSIEFTLLLKKELYDDLSAALKKESNAETCDVMSAALAAIDGI